LLQEGRLWILLGIALLETADESGATVALRRGFERGARDPRARCLLGVLYHEQERIPEAIAQYEAVIEQEGEYPLANLNLGIAYFALGKFEEAATKFERVLAFDEQNSSAHFYLGMLYKEYLAENEKALEHFERYRALGGDDARVSQWVDELR